MSLAPHSPSPVEGSSTDSHQTYSSIPPTLTSAASSTTGGPSHRRTSSGALTMSSRGRPSLRGTHGGQALGLEEEVEFGSDEDLLENVGEIEVPEVGWYPNGKYDSLSKGKGRSGEEYKRQDDDRSSRRATRLLGRKSEKSRGIGDAKVLSMDEIESPVELSRVDTGKFSSTSRGKVFDDNASMMSDVTSISGKDKTMKKTMFSKLFNKKKEDRFSSLPASPKLPPGVAAPRRPPTESIPASAQSSIRRSGRNSIIPSANRQPLSFAAVGTGSEPSDPPRQHPSGLASNHPRPQTGGSMTAIKSPVREVSRPNETTTTPPTTALKLASLSLVEESRALAPPSPIGATDSAFAPAPDATPRAPLPASSDLVHFLLPTFPTSPSAVESTTILSTMVMRRLEAKARSHHRPGTASSTGSAKKSIWQSHQLVLTSFKLNESVRGSVVEASVHEAQPGGSRTVAHLHLFSTQPRSKPGTPVKTPQWLTSSEPTEVERRAVAEQTTAGVWDSGAEGEGRRDTPDKSRKWVMRISWDDEEWLCDMPTRDALLEWIKQIKTYATVIRAEAMGFGSQIHSSLQNGGSRVDLALELDMLRKGLRSTSISSQHRAKAAPTSYRPPQLDNEEVIDDADPDSSGSEGVSPTVSQRRHSRPSGRRPSSAGSRASRRSSLVRPLEVPSPVPAPLGPPPAAPTAGNSLMVSVDDRYDTPPELPSSRLETAGSTPTLSITSIDTPESGTKSDLFISRVRDSTSSTSTAALFTPGLDAPTQGGKHTPIFLTPDMSGQTFVFPTPPDSAPAAELRKARFVDFEEYKPRSDRAETASLASSATGSTNARRRRNKAPAVDLMAELAARPDANYEVPEESPILPDESRSRRIRFAG